MGVNRRAPILTVASGNIPRRRTFIRLLSMGSKIAKLQISDRSPQEDCVFCGIVKGVGSRKIHDVSMHIKLFFVLWALLWRSVTSQRIGRWPLTPASRNSPSHCTVLVTSGNLGASKVKLHRLMHGHTAIVLTTLPLFSLVTFRTGSLWHFTTIIQQPRYIY